MQLKHVIRRLFDTIDVKSRDALDKEEFREMICFAKEDIFSHKEHKFGEEEED